MSSKLLAFAVFDSKAENFGVPQFFQTRGLATRAFTDEANRTESMICKHAEDYTFFCIGEYDPDKGLLTPLSTPQSLGVAVEFKTSE